MSRKHYEELFKLYKLLATVRSIINKVAISSNIGSTELKKELFHAVDMIDDVILVQIGTKQ